MAVGFIIWLTGAIIAWFQIKHWNKDNGLRYPEDYYVLALLSLLSWAIYPIYALQRIYEEINNR